MTSELVPENLVGHQVLDSEGNNVGKIKQVFLDDRTGEPSWVSIHTGLFGMRETLVPLQGAHPKEEDVQIPYDKATVKDAPHVDAERHVSPEDEAIVRDYFARHGGVPRQAGGEADRASAPTPTGAPADTDPEMTGAGGRGEAAADTDLDAPTGGRYDAPDMTVGGTGAAWDEPIPMGQADMASTDRAAAGTGSDGTDALAAEPWAEGGDTGAAVGRAPRDERLGGPVEAEDEEISVIRHEERVDIGVERHESGHARMRRIVETEHFDETVPLHHDELEVERRPITDPSEVTDDGVMEDGEQVFTLYEERPVVSKRSVPVEQVHVRKRDVTREEHVEGELRRERIEFEGDDGEPTSA
ncbi:PRC and DUF2382 domain-containing protein [Nocardiopsis sp. MG754419]|uniref:PRC and DUF2382 domain-containing protein n=1 Tax=Nocardiopsis sp. MG754419 TaxID=2259865 RepID=UPI001BA8C9C3|nr:PRC and DUF2382 domain-containing protein [Nocardiopsis sp. MG754419]MBR8744109.1 hypothetical protein [Nocardiopsis sp. MG754419]